MRCFVLLPAYNESQNLPRLLERIQALSGRGPKLSLIVVDDGSSDGTAEVAEACRGRLDLRVVRHERNLGFAQALRSGLGKALELGSRGDAVAVMDADDSQDPGLIPDLAEALARGCEVAIASRYAPGGGQSGVPVRRRALSRVCNWLLAARFPIPGVRDYTSSYRMIGLSFLQDLSARTGGRFFKEEGFGCAFELLHNLSLLGARAREVPLQLRYDRKRGASKMRVAQTVLRYLRLIFL